MADSKEENTSILPHHLKELEASGISEQLAREAGIRSVNAEVSREMTGVPAGAGWAVPYRIPADDNVTFQVKPDKPMVVGTDKRTLKYICPTGKPSRLYFPPGIAAVLGVISVALILTEGAKKVLSAVANGFWVVGVSGVWNWIKDGKAISDFDLITWRGRVVYIAYDSDAYTNPSVLQAQRRLVFELERRGAIVKIVCIPAGENGKKIGLDDGLVAHGKSWLEKLLAEARGFVAYEIERLRQIQDDARQLEIESLLNDCAVSLTPVRRAPLLAAISEEFSLPKKDLYDQIKMKQRMARTNTDCEATPDALNAFRRNTEIPAIQIRQLVCEVILQSLRARGTLLNSDRGIFYVDRDTGKVLDVAAPEFLALCHARYGCNEAELEWKHLLSNVTSWARTNAATVVVRELSYYYKEKHILYVDRGDGKVWRLDGQHIRVVMNGDDNVFLRTPGFAPVEPRFTKKINWDEAVFGLLQVDGNSGVPANLARLLVKVWFWGLFFPELLPTRPILCLFGEKGSAKTSSLRAMGRALMGPMFDAKSVSDSLRDLETSLVNGRFVVLDNMDDQVSAAVMNLLAMAATGGKITRRQLYTTATEVDYKICCFLAITSRTPNFRRDDIAERIIVIGVDRLKIFRPEAQIMAAVQAKRPKLWWVLLRELNRIVHQLKSPDDLPSITSYRLSDFANFGLKAVPAGRRDEWRSALAALQNAQAGFLLARDATAKALRTCMAVSPKLQGRDFTAAQLVTELQRAGGESALTEDRLGRRLRNAQDPLRAWFRVERRNKDGRSLYRLWLLDAGKRRREVD